MFDLFAIQLDILCSVIGSILSNCHSQWHQNIVIDLNFLENRFIIIILVCNSCDHRANILFRMPYFFLRYFDQVQTNSMDNSSHKMY